MALTISEIPASSTGKQGWAVAACTGDASYPTGGWTLTPTNLSLPGGVTFGLAVVDTPITGVQNAHYDYVNNKLKLFTSAGAEVANATNCAALVVNVLAFGGF